MPGVGRKRTPLVAPGRSRLCQVTFMFSVGTTSTGRTETSPTLVRPSLLTQSQERSACCAGRALHGFCCRGWKRGGEVQPLAPGVRISYEGRVRVVREVPAQVAYVRGACGSAVQAESGRTGRPKNDDVFRVTLPWLVVVGRIEAGSRIDETLLPMLMTVPEVREGREVRGYSDEAAQWRIDVQEELQAGRRPRGDPRGPGEGTVP